MPDSEARHYVDVKLAKAREFLEMADVSTAGPMSDAAASLAAVAAVNASDVVLFIATGVVSTRATHAQAVDRLRKAQFPDAGNQLARALSLKTKAQYDARRTTTVEARQAIKQAERLYETAKRLAQTEGYIS